jgi:beta-lactamase regulating signal transducer with metallopeptidase domain
MNNRSSAAWRYGLVIAVVMAALQLGTPSASFAAQKSAARSASVSEVQSEETADLQSQAAVNEAGAQTSPHAKATGVVTQKRAIPAVVWAAVWLIVQFGYYAVRFAPQVVQVFNNGLLRRSACQQLRSQRNWWGSSWLCVGT